MLEDKMKEYEDKKNSMIKSLTEKMKLTEKFVKTSKF
jgi:hypothetical protein